MFTITRVCEYVRARVLASACMMHSTVLAVIQVCVYANMYTTRTQLWAVNKTVMTLVVRTHITMHARAGIDHVWVTRHVLASNWHPTLVWLFVHLQVTRSLLTRICQVTCEWYYTCTYVHTKDYLTTPTHLHVWLHCISITYGYTEHAMTCTCR